MSKFDLDNTYDGGMAIPPQCRWCCHYDGHFCYWGGTRDKMEPNDSCGCFKVDRKDNTNMDEYVRRLEDENNSLRRRNKKLTDDVVEIRKLLTERDGRIDDLVNRCGVMEKNCESCKKINASLAKDAADIEIDNYNLRKRNEALDKRVTELVKSVEEKEAKISELMQQLADKNVIIKDLNAHNDELIKDFGEAAKEVEEKRTLIIKLGNEDREKEAKIASLTQELADSRNHRWSKDSYTKELEDQLDSKSDVVSEQELQIEDLKKKLDSLLDHNKALRLVLRSLYPETFKTWYLGRPMWYDDGTSKLSYKCCPEIKKLIDDSKERIEHSEQACRSMETFNLDVSSLYPKKFDLTPNADCPAYAARMKAKYDCLRKVGFTEDQTMSLLPLWIDE